MKMEQIISDVKLACYKEERPRYFLFLDATEEEEKKILAVKTPKYTAEFRKVCSGIFTTYCGGNVSVIGHSIESILGHDWFFLTEVAYVPCQL